MTAEDSWNDRYIFHTNLTPDRHTDRQKDRRTDRNNFQISLTTVPLTDRPLCVSSSSQSLAAVSIFTIKGSRRLALEIFVLDEAQALTISLHFALSFLVQKNRRFLYNTTQRCSATAKLIHQSKLSNTTSSNKDFTNPLFLCSESSSSPTLAFTYLLTPWSRVLLEKLTSKLCS